MTIRFSKKESRKCFGCGIEPPSYRVISLSRSPDRSGMLKQECGATLVCESCLGAELNGFYNALGQHRIPLEADENDESYLTRPIGLMVIPTSLDPSDARC